MHYYLFFSLLKVYCYIKLFAQLQTDFIYVKENVYMYFTISVEQKLFIKEKNYNNYKTKKKNTKYLIKYDDFLFIICIFTPININKTCCIRIKQSRCINSLWVSNIFNS